MDLPFPNPQDDLERGMNAWAELNARAQAEIDRPNPDGVIALKAALGSDPDVVDTYELTLLDRIERDLRASAIMDCGVTPRPYYDLAVYYRKNGPLRSEIALLEFFQQQKHAPGAMPGKLAERLEKARTLRAKRERK